MGLFKSTREEDLQGRRYGDMVASAVEKSITDHSRKIGLSQRDTQRRVESVLRRPDRP